MIKTNTEEEGRREEYKHYGAVSILMKNVGQTVIEGYGLTPQCSKESKTMTVCEDLFLFCSELLHVQQEEVLLSAYIA